MQLSRNLVRSFSRVRHWSDGFLIKTKRHPGFNKVRYFFRSKPNVKSDMVRSEEKIYQWGNEYG